MNKISRTTKPTVVKIFIKVVASALLISHSMAFAQSAPANSQQQPIILGGYPPHDPCEKYRQALTNATNKIGDACRKAGLGEVRSCIEKSKSCDKVSTEDSFDTTAAFATVLGLPAGTGIESLGKSCPQWNGRDYYTEKERLQKEIRDLEKELAELNDDKAEIENDYQKEMNDIQETLTKANEDYKKKSLELDERERERIAEFNASQNQAKEEMRKKGAEILRLRGQLIQSQRDKALKLIAMTEASGKRACMKAVNDAKKEYDKVSASTSANHIAQAKRKRQELINIYNDCMDAFDQQRIALNESKRQEQEEINKQINDAQSSYDEIQNSLNLANTQLEEMKQATAKEKQDALQSVIDLGTRSQQQMQAAHTKMQENLKTLQAKSASLQMALNRANQSLMTMGPAPKRGAEYAPSDASSDISAALSEIDSIQRDTPESCKNTKESAAKTKKSWGVK